MIVSVLDVVMTCCRGECLGFFVHLYKNYKKKPNRNWAKGVDGLDEFSE
ncbi:hypothetical protein BMY_1010 [Wohlfahrtiimonas chitiniclastica]|nr:hypothetical protein BMY_1010 [Wohlfahrtiimonas chitiniclastica]